MGLLEPEAAIWYSLCLLVVGARLWSRVIRFGSFRKLQLDDYLMVLAMVGFDTVLYITMHILRHTNSNLIAPWEDASEFTPAEIQERVYGSKLVIVTEQMQIGTTWLIKACILIICIQMTHLLPYQKIVWGVAVYVGGVFVLMETLYFALWCRPFYEMWAVPPSDVQCATQTHHLVTNLVLNISSDILIMLLPLPVILRLMLPWKKRLLLSGVFIIGLFSMVAAVWNKVASFKHPFAPAWMIWYLRESFTAIICANLPHLWPLIQYFFKVANFSHNSCNGPPRTGTRVSVFTSTGRSRLHFERNSHNHSVEPTESQERIHWDDLIDMAELDLEAQARRPSIGSQESDDASSDMIGVTTTSQAV